MRLALGDRQQSLADFSRCLQMENDNLEALFLSTIACYESGRIHKALLNIDRFLSLERNDAHAFFLRGLLHNVS
jgi:tetratricopeptide (TPR) repeat protein